MSPELSRKKHSVFQLAVKGMGAHLSWVNFRWIFLVPVTDFAMDFSPQKDDLATDFVGHLLSSVFPRKKTDLVTDFEAWWAWPKTEKCKSIWGEKPRIIECFRRQHRGWRNLTSSCSSLDHGSMKQMSLFYLKILHPREGNPWSTDALENPRSLTKSTPSSR